MQAQTPILPHLAGPVYWLTNNTTIMKRKYLRQRESEVLHQIAYEHSCDKMTHSLTLEKRLL